MLLTYALDSNRLTTSRAELTRIVNSLPMLPRQPRPRVVRNGFALYAWILKPAPAAASALRFCLRELAD